MSRAGQLAFNYAAVEEAICMACGLAGRKRNEVLLLAVSKFHSFKDILELASLGQTAFGENYLQEARGKIQAATDAGKSLSWHMIGHVQRRKAAHVAGRFALVHSLDAKELALGMEHKLQSDGCNFVQDVLIEVNIGNEPQKSGVPPPEVPEFGAYVLDKCPHLRICGLMCMPPASFAGDHARPFFAKLRQLRERLEPNLGIALPHLSMGMSDDFAQAISEGATIVRIGTAIFGPRQQSRRQA